MIYIIHVHVCEAHVHVCVLYGQYVFLCDIIHYNYMYMYVHVQCLAQLTAYLNSNWLSWYREISGNVNFIIRQCVVHSIDDTICFRGKELYFILSDGTIDWTGWKPFNYCTTYCFGNTCHHRWSWWGRKIKENKQVTSTIIIQWSQSSIIKEVILILH